MSKTTLPRPPEALRTFGLPSLTPRALAMATASLVRRAFVSRSVSATSAMLPTVRSLVSVISHAMNRTPLSRRASRERRVSAQPIQLGDDKWRSLNLCKMRLRHEFGPVGPMRSPYPVMTRCVRGASLGLHYCFRDFLLA